MQSRRVCLVLVGTAVLLLACVPSMVATPEAHAIASASFKQSVQAASAFPDKGVLPYGDAAYEGAPTNLRLASPVVGMAANPKGPGYWLVAADGGVFAYGTRYFGSGGAINLYAPIVGMAATPDGGGYWLVALDGGVFSFGDAHFYGSTGNIRLAQPIVGMAPTADGKGYWLVASDGGVFSFGDAHFYGSTGKIHLAAPIVGMARTKNGGGYWLAASDGGVFTFGNAPFEGSPAKRGVPDWVSGFAPTSDNRGYWIADADGVVFAEGDAHFYGDNVNTPRTEVIAGITPSHDYNGYWLLEPDAFPTIFSHPSGGGSIVAIAASQIGPDPVNGYFCNPYGPCEAWCALFATWVWRRAGVPIPSYAFVGYVYDWAAAHTGVLPPNAKPRPGDLVLYGTGPQTVDTAVHMGVVAQVWPDGAIDTVEGDAGPGPDGYLNVIINGPFLPSDSKDYNGFGIFGFAEP